MRFRTWNAKSTYRARSLTAATEEISKYKLDFVGAEEVRRDGVGTEPADEYTFLYGKRSENHELGTDFCTLTNGKWRHRNEIYDG
jgi:hypothetical protein